MNVLRTGALVLVALGMSLGTSLAADIGGTWLTEGGEATVRLASCGDAVCGTIVALKQPKCGDSIYDDARGASRKAQLVSQHAEACGTFAERFENPQLAGSE